MIFLIIALEALVCPDQQTNAFPQNEGIHSLITHKEFVKATAYDPYDEKCVGEWANVPGPRKTATGADAETPGFAADPKMFPEGTLISLPGYGTFRVDDIGGGLHADARRGIKSLDVRMTKRPGENAEHVHHRAELFALQWLTVEVWPQGYVSIFSNQSKQP